MLQRRLRCQLVLSSNRIACYLRRRVETCLTILAPVSLVQEPALFGDGDGIPCAVENSDDNKFLLTDLIVDSIWMMKRHAQLGAELIAGCSHQWRLPHYLKSFTNTIKKTGGNRFTCFSSKICPDFCEVGFCCVGEAQA